MPSKALEVNLASSRIDIKIEEKYRVIQEVMERYHGLQESLRVFLEEICHPYRNWDFIVKEARNFALNYFHALREQPRGEEAAALYLDVLFQAVNSSRDEAVRLKAVDNLLLFIQKILKESDADLPRFLPVLDAAFDRIRESPEKAFYLFVKSFYQLDRLGRLYAESLGDADRDCTAVNRLLAAYHQFTCAYWLAREDPRFWFEKETGFALHNTEGLRRILHPVSHERLEALGEARQKTIQETGEHSRNRLERLLHLEGFGRIVKEYRNIGPRLSALGTNRREGNELRLIFLLQTMNEAGLSSIHEETLREINRTLSWLIQHEELETVQESLKRTCAILRLSMERFPDTALNCVMNAGQAVYRTDESDLVDYFQDLVISLGFEPPRILGVGGDWQVKVNPAHIKNIRTWLQLIELHPKWSKKLLSSLIIHLSLTGVFIKDTDLFPRDITRFLNSDIAPVYNLVKQLTRLFPAYFNDIGSEGKLRDISTRIDEVCRRKDVLVHFLRKQSHVESSNRIIGLMEGVFEFWKTRDREAVRPFVPPGIFEEIETNGPYVDGVHRLLNQLMEIHGLDAVHDLLKIDESAVDRAAAETIEASAQDVERMQLAVSFYKLLYQKYHLSFTETESCLAELKRSGLPDLDRLKEAFQEDDKHEKLARFLDYLENLKEMILYPESYEVREDIYRKRHFTVDIPSMYGSYHEPKFDALGLTFRLERMVNVLFEDLVEDIELSLITRATFSQIYDYLRLFQRALRLDGIPSLGLERQLDLLSHALEIRGFSLTQYLDIFRGLSQAVGNIVNDYFNNIHAQNLLKIVGEISESDLLPKYVPGDGTEDRERLAHRVTEIFLRERISTSMGLQQLDVFLGRILNTLRHQSEELPREKLGLLLGYDPQKALTPIHPVKPQIADLIHLGNKGLNLVRITAYGLPVPPGFIISTEVFRCRELIEGYLPARRNFRQQVKREVAALEEATGKTFGQAGNPLLLSVRSGSSVSQPGMMNTFLDVGINEAIVEDLAAMTGNTWFAWDTYRRFLQSYGMAFGLVRDTFDDIIQDRKERAGVPFKKDLTGEQIRDVALTYKELILESGIELEEDPIGQLHTAIQKVFDSWYAPKAQAYRKIMGISDDWGTAVTVQAMVFGNFSRESGSGVFFTHNPRWSGDMLMPWGDFTLGNQGEDVVAGLVRTFPISVKQAEIENREAKTSLEAQFPELYRVIRDRAKELVYGKRWSPQEMEFTFEGPEPGSLYFLQTREMAMRERKEAYSFDFADEAPPKPLGHGIGVSGGAMAGRVVFSLEEIHRWRKKEPETPLIIVRNDTVPDDIREINQADGLLTARGGSTSHAAIVAHRLGKTCVVGCSGLHCMEKESACSLNHKALKSGDWISIDGDEGSVYIGRLKIREMERI